jgi:hypothetical protein
MLRRILFGFFWFGIFWMGVSMIGLGISMSHDGTPSPVSTTSDAAVVDAKTAGDFRERHGWTVVGVAAALAALGTWKGWLPGTRS